MVWNVLKVIGNRKICVPQLVLFCHAIYISCIFIKCNFCFLFLGSFHSIAHAHILVLISCFSQAVLKIWLNRILHHISCKNISALVKNTSNAAPLFWVLSKMYICTIMKNHTWGWTDTLKVDLYMSCCPWDRFVFKVYSLIATKCVFSWLLYFYYTCLLKVNK